MAETVVLDPQVKTSATAADEAVVVSRRRFTVPEYLRLVEVGILTEDDRVELINGEILAMSPINIRHTNCVNILDRILHQIPPESVIVSVQNPIQLDEYSLPQPDIALWRPREGGYDDYPGPRDILLLVEVSDSSLPYDQGSKLERYYRAGVSEVWLVNLQEKVLEIYREPSADGYRTLHRRTAGDKVSSEAFPDFTLNVADIL